jgi:hypothetical protein
MEHHLYSNKNNLHASFFRRIVFIIILFLCTLLLICYIYDTPREPSISSVAIIILGGGVTAEGNVPNHTQLRINEAVRLFHLLSNQQSSSDSLNGHPVIITLSGGTPHKPNPLDPNGFPIWESTAAAKRLIDMGISPDHILEESFSLDTVGNVSNHAIIHFTYKQYFLLFCC